MKKATSFIGLILLFIACSGRSDQNEQKETVITVDSSSPSEVVMTYFMSMEKEDSMTIINSLATEPRAQLIPLIAKTGGFKKIFDLMKGTHYEMKVLRVDTVSSDVAKVYVNQNLSNGSTMQMRFDSLYYTVYRENGVWKLTALNSKKD